jgi:hypothetical protein
MLAFTVLLIHSEMVWLFAFAEAITRLIVFASKRTGTIRPLASPFGNSGRPIFFLVLLCWLKAFKLLHDCSAYSITCRLDGMRM